MLKEVKEAYRDCWADEPFSVSSEKRNLGYYCETAVGRDEAIKVLSEAIPHGYNEFKADLLSHLPEDSMIHIARAGSVCIYVVGNIPVPSAMLANEWGYDNHDNLTRIWWD